MDLEFSTNKLNHETQLFLHATRDKDLNRFEKIQKTNKLWIDFRMNSDRPVQLDDLVNAAMLEDDEQSSELD